MFLSFGVMDDYGYSSHIPGGSFLLIAGFISLISTSCGVIRHRQKLLMKINTALSSLNVVYNPRGVNFCVHNSELVLNPLNKRAFNVAPTIVIEVLGVPQMIPSAPPGVAVGVVVPSAGFPGAAVAPAVPIAGTVTVPQQWNF